MCSAICPSSLKIHLKFCVGNLVESQGRLFCLFFNGLHFSRCFAQLRIFNIINEHLLRINKAWQAHAKLSSAGGANSTSQALHGHAKNILRALARDLEGMPSQEQAENAIAPLSFGKASETFLVVQAALQKTDAIDLAQFTMELGALRAVILKLSLAENLQEPETAGGGGRGGRRGGGRRAAGAARGAASGD